MSYKIYIEKNIYIKKMVTKKKTMFVQNKNWRKYRKNTCSLIYKCTRYWYSALIDESSLTLQFNPGLVLVSAGFDAARGDPLGGYNVTPEGYAHLTHMLKSLAGGRILLILEVR